MLKMAHKPEPWKDMAGMAFMFLILLTIYVLAMAIAGG